MRRGCSSASASLPNASNWWSDIGGMHSFHPEMKEKPGRKPLSDIKVMKEDAAAVEKNAEEIKAHYTKIFRV